LVLATALAAGLALASVGCGGSGGAPPGMMRFADRGLVLDYPSGWKKEDVRGGARGFKLNVRGPADAHGLYVRATLFRQPREYTDNAAYGKDIRQIRALDLRDGRAVFDGPLSVPGASDGGWIVRTDFSYPEWQEVPDASGRVARAHGQRAVPAEHRRAAGRARALAGGLGDEEVAACWVSSSTAAL